MWSIISFDLSVETREQQREYRTFRAYLLRNEYQALQRSLYARWFDNADVRHTFLKSLKQFDEINGNIMEIAVSEEQFRSTFHIGERETALPEKRTPWLIL